MSGLAEAREALRQRLGKGARYDDPAAPARELALARMGTAYFARKLNELSDAALALPALPAGLTRRHVIAGISYEARALAQLAEWARTGQDVAEGDPFAAIAPAVELAVTLPAEALRHLFRHSEVHLNVEWRDLTAKDWDAPVRLPGGRVVTARGMASRRARSIWLGAIDLDNGGAFDDLPPDLIDALLADPTGAAGHPSPVLRPDDRPAPSQLDPAGGDVTVSGSAGDLARWITGRGIRQIAFDGGPAFEPPLRKFYNDLEHQG
ncbi:maleylpyruvate isomerase family mycothiol-dependent enzyme [Halodurantibacterium flavum]|uniref:Maleylpyruvate isomerase family mycothiol-dependent enzyme n=1 Tax=Halodurantibacterium flavum TaxID=1382802 RepID=A0ABW4S721_9RHOB